MIPSQFWNGGTEGDYDWQDGNLEIDARWVTAASGEFGSRNLGTRNIARYEWYYNRTLGIWTMIENSNRWVSVNVDIIRGWDKTVYGDTWELIFMEEDGGGGTAREKVSITSKFDAGIKYKDGLFNASFNSTISQEGEITINVDKLGDVLIKRCYPCDTPYTFSGLGVSIALEW